MKNKELWPFLFFVGLLCFNWPMMDLFAAVLPYYLYSVWALFILTIGWLITLKQRRDKEQNV
jgi:hypothetical protein